MQTIDLSDVGLRETNKTLHDQSADTNQTAWEIVNPRAHMPLLAVWMPQSK